MTLSIEEIRALEALEWSAGENTAPSYMGGPEGTPVPACPSCHGIHPTKGKHEFVESALGHRKDCSLKAILDKYS